MSEIQWLKSQKEKGKKEQSHDIHIQTFLPTKIPQASSNPTYH